MALNDNRIMIVGVGGAGCKIVSKLHDTVPSGPRTAVISTDSKALSGSSVPARIQIGSVQTGGLGAGGNPEIGNQSALDDAEMLRGLFSDVGIVIVVAGLGGGTGTGATPVVLDMARERGALTICFATRPFNFEGHHRSKVADEQIEKLAKSSDMLIMLSNDLMLEFISEANMGEAFAKVDDIVINGICAVWMMVARPGLINLDFADLQRVVQNSEGVCVFGYGDARGSERGKEAVRQILDSPLLEKGKTLEKAKALLVSIIGGHDMLIRDVDEVIKKIREKASADAEFFMGTIMDEDWKDRLTVTVIAAMEWSIPEEKGKEPSERKEVKSQSGGRKGKQNKQGNLDFSAFPDKGRFKGMGGTIMNGEDLDIPTYYRKGIEIGK